MTMKKIQVRVPHYEPSMRGDRLTGHKVVFVNERTAGLADLADELEARCKHLEAMGAQDRLEEAERTLSRIDAMQDDDRRRAEALAQAAEAPPQAKEPTDHLTPVVALAQTPNKTDDQYKALVNAIDALVKELPLSTDQRCYIHCALTALTFPPIEAPKPAELWEFGHPQFFGAIVEMRTGVRWSNQTGGTACGHPSTEGIFVPFISNAPGGSEDTSVFFNDYGLAYAPEKVTKFLRDLGIEEMFEPLTKEEADAGKYFISEAWVPVRIKKIEEPCYQFRGARPLLPFAGKIAIITHANSD